MFYTDEMKESHLLLEKDIEELKKLGSKRLQAKLDHLEGDLGSFLDAAAEAMEIWDAEELSEYEEFDLLVHRLAGLAEELCALGLKRPESVCTRLRSARSMRFFNPCGRSWRNSFVRSSLCWRKRRSPATATWRFCSGTIWISVPFI